MSLERSNKHYFGKTGKVHSDQNPNATDKGKMDDAIRERKVNNKVVQKMFDDVQNKVHHSYDDYRAAGDSADRHMRRHPDAYKEQGIFAECNFM